MSATRAPFETGADREAERRLAELERSLRQLELSLSERERAVEEAEARLAERERDLAEAEALMEARAKLAAVSRPASTQPHPVQGGGSPSPMAALEQVRLELDRQAGGIGEAQRAIREREKFLEESEAKLFEKVQMQQEKEIELEQRDEDLRARERALRGREAAIDPVAAATWNAEQEAARQLDELRE